MLLELREDRFEAGGHMMGALIPSDFDAIDEQEEQARAEVRMTGALFAFPTGEAFCGMNGYSPPVPPYRTPKPATPPPFKGPTATEVAETKRVEEARLAARVAKKAAEAKRSKKSRAAEAEHLRERLYNDRQKAKSEAKRRARVQRWMAEDALERPAWEIKPATVKLPVYCGNEPTDAPIYRKGDYASHKVDPGSEFTVLWPGHPINRRLFVCKSREEIMFNGGTMKEAVVFDMDGREMRIEAAACWDTFVFNILGEKKP